ncbi:hypothetical protein TWF696_003145 [Orbilia brochopaga]|uniref:Transmembrane protein n=1 Tax=Orbilia brochopaga TaxID=3140254 RepID=A0AAV9TZ71_9PEZI
MAVSQGTISKFLMIGTLWLLLGTLWLMYIWPDQADVKPVRTSFSAISMSNINAPNAASTRVPVVGGTAAIAAGPRVMKNVPPTTYTRTTTIIPQSTSSPGVRLRTTTTIDFAQTQPGGGRVVVAAMAKPGGLDIFDAAGRRMFPGKKNNDLIRGPTGTEKRPQKTIFAKPRVSAKSVQ